MKDEDNVNLQFLACLSAIPLIAATVIIRGFILSLLWAWFFIPLGLESISIPHAIGIAGTVAYITESRGMGEKINTSEVAVSSFLSFARAIGFSGATLLISYIVHKFM